jgi:hypothetical protein
MEHPTYGGFKEAELSAAIPPCLCHQVELARGEGGKRRTRGLGEQRGKGGGGQGGGKEPRISGQGAAAMHSGAWRARLGGDWLVD